MKRLFFIFIAIVAVVVFASSRRSHSTAHESQLASMMSDASSSPIAVTAQPSSSSSSQSASGSHHARRLVPCPICSPYFYAKGTGQCYKCEGRGCSECKGTGQCFWCSGSGSIEDVGTEQEYREFCLILHPVDLDPDWWQSPPTRKREVSCDVCLGTGSVPYSTAHVLPSMNYDCTDCSLARDSYSGASHVCRVEQCYRCHKPHCTSSNIHVRCKNCDGKGKVQTRL